MGEKLTTEETTVKIFKQRVIRFQKEHPKVSEKLAGDLLEWASLVPLDGTLGETVASQIDYQVDRRRKSGNQIATKEYIDMLFSLNPAGKINSDIIMGRLQLG